MMIRKYSGAATLLITSVLVGMAAGNEPSAEALLKEKGLNKRSTHFALAEETDVTSHMTAFAKLKKKVTDAQREEHNCNQVVENKKQQVVVSLQQRRALRDKLQRVGNVDEHNRIVDAINELADRVQLLETPGAEEKALSAAHANADRAREAYTEHLLATRKLLDKVKEKYGDMAANTQVTEAIDRFNKENDKQLKLGPTPSLIGAEKQLTKLEDTVLSEAIDMRKGDGDLWSVPVVFNGKYAQQLDVDTGASLIALPWDVAKKLGLTPKETDLTIHLVLADGREVEAKQVFAESVRVGKFIVEHVECAVMPEELVKAGAMLGQSYLKHFTYKVDTNAAKLVMSKVETGEKEGPPKKTKGKK